MRLLIGSNVAFYSSFYHGAANSFHYFVFDASRPNKNSEPFDL